MATRLATLFSYVFHPMFVPVYVLVLLPELDALYHMILSWKIRLMITGTLVVTMVIIPLLIVLLMVRMKLISSLRLPLREDRFFPLMIMALVYYLTFYLLRELYLPQGFLLFLLGSTILIIVSLLITLRFRISLHTLALGGTTGLFLGLTFLSGGDHLLFLIMSILVSGIAGWARLQNKTHSPAEIYTGWLTGLVIMATTCLFL